MDLDALRQIIRETLAIQVATSSEDLLSYMVRGFGVDLMGDELRVAVVEAQAVTFLSTLRRTRRIAVNLTHPLTFVARQLKGTLVAIDEPSEEAAAIAADYFARFVRVIEPIGVTPEQARGLFLSGSPTCWVRMKPRDFFDQTPGSGAGRQL